MSSVADRVTLREITAETVRAVVKLAGFVMLSDDSLLDPVPENPKLSLSYVPEEGGPEQLYLSLGFRPTGEMEEDEVVMELELSDHAAPPLVIGDAMAHIAYVNVFVRDLDRATEFYRDTLGLQLQYASPEHGYASFAAGGVRLGIAVPGPEQTELVGRHTGVGLAVADLEGEYVRLTGLGVRFDMPPTRQPWGGFMSLVSDPDGNVFYLERVAAERA